MWFKQCKAGRLPATPDAAVLADALFQSLSSKQAT